MSTVDALVNSTIKNKISSSDVSAYLPSSYSSTSTSSQVLDMADEVLDQTTIKRACCLANGIDSTATNFIVNVKLPIYPDYDFDALADNGATEMKFGYINKQVSVPLSMCPSGYAPGDDQADNDGSSYNNCDTFYSIYCANARKVYQDKIDKLGQAWDTVEFSKYAPDCSCYNQTPTSIKTAQSLGYTINYNPSCVFQGCSSSASVYEDPVTREGSINCSSINVCSSTMDFKNISAGGNIDIDDAVEQACGFSSSTDSTDSSDGGSSNADPAVVANDDGDNNVTSDDSSDSGSSSGSSGADSSDGSDSDDNSTEEKTSLSLTDWLIIGGIAFMGLLCVIIFIVIIAKLGKGKSNSTVQGGNGLDMSGGDHVYGNVDMTQVDSALSGILGGLL